ncbi:unnamed protein product [Linum trigynum]|uniref:Uncharacterized protein n=1 Tax=Linum trigynum TaxID=586398 RepID=A0AAV2FUK0_9ROSI
MWLEDSRFYLELDKWMNEGVSGSGCVFLLARRLLLVKSRVKVWNKEVFGNIDTKVDELSCKIMELDVVEEQRPLLEEEMCRRANMALELSRALYLKEICWRQKSREGWIKLGERNTGYFHKAANYRRKLNFINRIRINGQMIEDKEDLGMVLLIITRVCSVILTIIAQFLLDWQMSFLGRATVGRW